MIRLVRLSPVYRDQLFEMMEEWSAAGEKIIPYAIRRYDYRDFERYLAQLEVKENDPDGWVPDSTFFALEEESNTFVGAVNIRHRLNDYLLNFGGHIGDGVRPSRRGEGIGTKIVALALKECETLGMSRVLMVCDKANIASARTIIKNGGVLENEVIDDGEIVQRYWIEV